MSLVRVAQGKSTRNVTAPAPDTLCILPSQTVEILDSVQADPLT